MNRIKRVWAGVAFLLLASPALGAAAESVDPEDLQQMLQGGEKLFLVDTMSELECRDQSIPGSLCLAVEELPAKASRLLPDKNRPLIFYCDGSGCGQSAEAAAIALKAGYTRVSILSGGLPAWRQAGYPIVSRERIPRASGEAVKPERLVRWLAEKRDLLILDVRRESAFAEGHLPGALNLPLGRLHERYQELPLNRPVLVVDERGLRSLLVCSYLVRKGLRDVKRLLGGMERWRAEIAPEKKKK